MKKLMFLVAFAAIGFCAEAQIEVTNTGVGIGVNPQTDFHVLGNTFFDGNVGIGRDNPTYKLDVNGNGFFGEKPVGTSGAIERGVIIGTYHYSCGHLTESRPAVYSSTTDGLLLGIPTKWAHATFSSNIYYLDGCLWHYPTSTPVSLCYKTDFTKNIAQIVTYEKPYYKGEQPVSRGETSEQVQYVFLADELQEVFPQLVSVYDTCDGGEGEKVINYVGMIPILTAAINEQQDFIEAQQDITVQHEMAIAQLQTSDSLQQITIDQQQWTIVEMQEAIDGLRDTVSLQQITIDQQQWTIGEIQEAIYGLRDTVSLQQITIDQQQGEIGDLQMAVYQQQQDIDQHQIEIEILQQIAFEQEMDLMELRGLPNKVDGLQDMVYDQQQMINALIDIISTCCKNGPIIWKRDSLSSQENNNKNKQSKIPEEAVLYQNTPNPFTSNTEISCDVPVINSNAAIYIYNLNGVELMSYPIVQTGYSTVTVYASVLPAGMYLYTLVVDGVIIDTKRMILTK